MLLLLQPAPCRGRLQCNFVYKLCIIKARRTTSHAGCYHIPFRIITAPIHILVLRWVVLLVLLCVHSITIIHSGQKSAILFTWQNRHSTCMFLDTLTFFKVLMHVFTRSLEETKFQGLNATYWMKLGRRTTVSYCHWVDHCGLLPVPHKPFGGRTIAFTCDWQLLAGHVRRIPSWHAILPALFLFGMWWRESYMFYVTPPLGQMPRPYRIEL
jgi:hypothetical protein